MSQAQLFGRAVNNSLASMRLLLTLRMYWGIGWVADVPSKLPAGERYQVKCVVVHAPGGHDWWFLNDNGGEINLGKINYEDSPSVPTTDFRGPLTVETVAYRIAMTIMGRPVDYDFKLDHEHDGPLNQEPIVLQNSL